MRAIRIKHRGVTGSAWFAAALVLSFAAPLAGQLPNASAAALGMGENHTAVARGFSAVAWNPAGLGMPDGPGSSFAIFSLRATTGLGPIGLRDIKEFEGKAVPDATRREWLNKIIEAGAEEGSAGTDLTLLALSAGRVGLQVAASGHVVGRIGPQVAELLLFGNAGRTGNPVDFALEGSSLDVVATSAGALSYAQPIIREPDRWLAVGATLKRTLGHVMITARDSSSVLTSNPLAVNIRFPVVQVDSVPSTSRLINGGGFGLDLGVGLQLGQLTAGLAVQNVFNNFEWDEEKLFYRPGVAVVNADTSTTDFDPIPIDEAPAGLAERAKDLEFSPSLGAGIGYRVRPNLLLAADFRRRFDDSRRLDPATHVGAGVQFEPLGFITLRGGAAAITDGFMLTGGLSLGLGPADISFAITAQETEIGSGSMVMFTLSSAGQ